MVVICSTIVILFNSLVVCSRDIPKSLKKPLDFNKVLLFIFLYPPFYGRDKGVELIVSWTP